MPIATTTFWLATTLVAIPPRSVTRAGAPAQASSAAPRALEDTRCREGSGSWMTVVLRG
jgi:hypothetical protein